MLLSISLLCLLLAGVVLAFDLRSDGKPPERTARAAGRMLLYAAAVVSGSALVLEAGSSSVVLVFLVIPLISVSLWRLYVLVCRRWAAPAAPVLLALGLISGVLLWLRLLPGELQDVSLIQEMLDVGGPVPKPDSIDPDAYRIIRS